MHQLFFDGEKVIGAAGWAAFYSILIIRSCLVGHATSVLGYSCGSATAPDGTVQHLREPQLQF